jgi:hypothetical protein
MGRSAGDGDGEIVTACSSSAGRAGRKRCAENNPWIGEVATTGTAGKIARPSGDGRDGLDGLRYAITIRRPTQAGGKEQDGKEKFVYGLAIEAAAASDFGYNEISECRARLIGA